MRPSPRLRIASSSFCLIAALALTFVSPAAATAHATTMGAPENTPAPGERALLGRLVAPCCWQQTLDVHTGPMADALRAESRKRLWAGETAEQVEAAFVARFGPRVRGVPQDNPIVGVSLGIGVLSLLVAGSLFIAIRRWRRAGQTEPSPSPNPTVRDAYDELLDDELRSMSS